MVRTNFIGFMIVALFLSGCAVGRYSYHTVSADISLEGTSQVGVATHDQRSYIVKGEKEPDFVGLWRSGVGIPFGATTASGNSLAQDMTDTIVRSLRSKGFHAIAINVNYSDSVNTVKAALKSTDARRSLLLTLNEWKSDTYKNTALTYNVSIEVLDENGKAIAQKSISGKDDLRGSPRKVIPVAFKEKVESLLNSREVSDALE